MDTVYQNYYQSFLDVAKKHLKPGICIKCQFYPFYAGALIYIELIRGTNDKAIQRKKEGTLSAALHHANLFDAKTCESFSGRNINETLYYIFSSDRYLIFKSFDEKDWSIQAASDDFRMIMKKLLEKYGEQK